MSNNKLTVGFVQEQWHKDPIKHQANLAKGIEKAAQLGAKLVCLQELTLSPYFCTNPQIDPKPFMEDAHTGPSAQFVSALARLHQITISASLFEKGGFNTAVAFDASGKLAALTRKQHIPSGEKYHEDHYFKAGDSDYPVHTLV